MTLSFPRTSRARCAFLVLVSALFFYASPLAAATVNDPGTFNPVVPNLSPQTTPPGLIFTVPSSPKEPIVFLAQYINAFYRYALGLAVIFAIIMIMVGGFQYILSGAIEGVKSGKKKIVDAFTALIVLFSAFAIFNTIAPGILNLRGISISGEDDASAVYDKPDDSGPGSSSVPILSPAPAPGGGGSGAAAPGASSDVDKLLQAYAACYGFDWRILKAVSYKESSLRTHPPFTCSGPKPCQCGDHAKDSTKFNCYTGLFQFEAEGCTANIHVYPNSLGLKCGTREQPDDNPETSTAAAAHRFSVSLQEIQAACGSQNMTLEDTIFLLYTGHNNGPSVMRYALQKHACKKSEQLTRIKEFYPQNPKTAAALNRSGKPTDANYWDVIYARAEAKWNVSNGIMQKLNEYGVSVLYPSNGKQDALCPINTGRRVYTGT